MVLAHHLNNLQRRLTGARSKTAHFIRDHRKTPPVFAGPRCFDGRVQRQQVGLLGDVANSLDDGADDVRLLADRIDTDSRFVEVAGNVLNDLNVCSRHVSLFERGVF